MIDQVQLTADKSMSQKLWDTRLQLLQYCELYLQELAVSHSEYTGKIPLCSQQKQEKEPV